MRSAIIDAGSRRRGKRGKRLGTTHGQGYVNCLMGSINRMLKRAVADELIPASVHDALCAVENLKMGRSPNTREPEKIKPIPDEYIPPERALVKSCILKFLD